MPHVCVLNNADVENVHGNCREGMFTESLDGGSSPWRTGRRLKPLVHTHPVAAGRMFQRLHVMHTLTSVYVKKREKCVL